MGVEFCHVKNGINMYPVYYARISVFTKGNQNVSKDLSLLLCIESKQKTKNKKDLFSYK